MFYVPFLAAHWDKVILLSVLIFSEFQRNGSNDGYDGQEYEVFHFEPYVQ